MFNIFKQVIQNEHTHFPRRLGKIKARRLQIYIQLIEKLVINIVEQFGDFLIENSCCSFLKTLFSDRHYRILNWSKKTRAHVCTEDEEEIFIGTGGLLDIVAYICRQRLIIHCIH